MIAAKYEDNPEEDKYKEEYTAILNAFRKLIYSFENSAESWDIFEEIVTLRCSFLIDEAITGLRLDFDAALNILRNYNTGLTERDKQIREVLVAAIDNLVDFSIAEEFQMVNDLPDEIDLNNMEEYEQICEKYNYTYASQENKDVLYAASVASWWIDIPSNEIITYMTQGDERVRASHLALEGLSFPKNEFPSDLIPPIDYACRCYLMSNGFESHVFASLNKTYSSKMINPIFSESLATRGRIFNDKHPYFKIPKNQHERLKKIGKRIKDKFMIYA